MQQRLSARRKQLITIFWEKFTQCKKDDDFRNFASLVDSVEQLQLSFSSSERSGIPLSFFKSLNGILDIDFRWHSIAKHSTFCLIFLSKVLAICSYFFFVENKDKQFLEALLKFCRNGDVEKIQLIALFIHDVPE